MRKSNFPISFYRFVIYCDFKIENSFSLFLIPRKSWIQLAFKVLNNKIIFYHNCIETEVANISKEPKELIFDSASTFYLAQAGPLINEKFVVSVFFAHFFPMKSFYSNVICEEKTLNLYGRKIREQKFSFFAGKSYGFSEI